MIPKILAPFNRVEEIGDLIETGADELYCGLIDPEWTRKYPIVGINRRVEPHANLASHEDLKRGVEIAHSYNASVALTINEHYYTQAQYPYLLEYVGRALDAGVDAFIVSDLALVLALTEKGIPIPLHLSTGGTVFNAEAGSFYRELGISRITIPRHMTLNEIGQLARGLPGMETSVFILNSRCANIDGFCTFDHTPFRCPDPAKFLGREAIEGFPEHVFSKDMMATGCCNLPYEVTFHPGLCLPVENASRRDQERTNAALARQRIWDRHHIDDVPCGACALHEFSGMGVTTVKIVGRGNPTRRKIGDVGFIRMLLALLEGDGLSRDEFRQTARDLRKANYGRACTSVNCYYGELLPKEETENGL